MRAIIAMLLLAAPAFAETMPEPGRFSVSLTTTRPPAVVTSRKVLPTGYRYEYSNGTSINETFAECYVRTGIRPAETQPQCSTGHCGTFSSYPTIATGGCRCGCSASTCSCHHSPNAGLPLYQQTYEPGRTAANTRGRR